MIAKLGGADRDSVFVHASARGGSTYIFNVLRRTESLLCFDEPISDDFTYFDKNDYARRVARGEWNWSHSFLRRFSRAEFVDAWDDVMHLYPQGVTFRDYAPRDRIISDELKSYLAALIQYANRKGKRAALCDIYSRGRAGVLRDAFGGFHVAQYRDPISQFGSCFRGLQEYGAWLFLIIPLWELGPSAKNPFYSIIPEAWRVPALAWPADNRAQRWASTEEYLAMILSPEPQALETLIRWHLLSWFLNNLAAIIYSDLTVDMDRLFDDVEYRDSVGKTLALEIGARPDFSDLTKFTRYYTFEHVDIHRICNEIVAIISDAHEDGTLDIAIASLSKGTPIVSTAAAIETLHAKIESTMATMASLDGLTKITSDQWKGLVRKHRHFWADPRLRRAMCYVYPYALPLVRAGRKIGMLS
jgi:hypothetical protein